MSVPCGPGSNVREVIESIFFGPGYNDAGGIAALNTIDAGLQSTRDKLSLEASKIGIVIVWLLAFIVLISLIFFIVWIGYELGISFEHIVVIIILLIIIAIILSIFAMNRAVNTINNIIQTSLGNLSAFSNRDTLNAAQSIINGAAGAYLTAIGRVCFP